MSASKTEPDSGLRRRLLWAKVVGGVVAVLFGVFVVLAVIAAVGRPPAASSSSSQIVGEQAPTFSLSRLGGGPAVSLAEAHGRPVVLAFFASWCVDCQKDLSSFGGVAVAHPGVAFLGVDANDSNPSGARSLLRKAGDTFPVGVDFYNDVSTRYLLHGLPTAVFISASGKVVGEVLGAISVPTLEKWVAKAVAAS